MGRTWCTYWYMVSLAILFLVSHLYSPAKAICNVNRVCYYVTDACGHLCLRLREYIGGGVDDTENVKYGYHCTRRLLLIRMI